MISIVSPVYNELEVLPEFCRRLTAVMEEYREPYEIVLVNDGSKDQTAEVVKNMASIESLKRRPTTTAGTVPMARYQRYLSLSFKMLKRK